MILLSRCTAIIFANGDLNVGLAITGLMSTLAGAANPLVVIAADGGLRHVATLGLKADLVIGDMDSVDPVMLAQAEQQGAETRRYPTHKDETDLELALIAAAQRGCTTIYILGAIGDRFDQTISNVYLLLLSELQGRDVRLVDGKQTIWLVHPGETLINGQPDDTVSLIPLLGDVIGIQTEGLAYPLRHETLKFGPARGVSNVLITSPARVTFEHGLLLIVHTIGRA